MEYLWNQLENIPQVSFLVSTLLHKFSFLMKRNQVQRSLSEIGISTLYRYARLPGRNLGLETMQWLFLVLKHNSYRWTMQMYIVYSDFASVHIPGRTMTNLHRIIQLIYNGMHIFLSYVATQYIYHVWKLSSSEQHIFVMRAAGRTFTAGGWILPAYLRKWMNMSNVCCFQYLYQQKVARYVCRYAGFSPKNWAINLYNVSLHPRLFGYVPRFLDQQNSLNGWREMINIFKF